MMNRVVRAVFAAAVVAGCGSAWADVHLTAKATGPGGLLRFGDGEAAAEVSCDTAEAVTLTAVPQEGYVFYRWIGDTDGMDEATVTGATLSLDADRAKSYRAVFLRKTGTGTATLKPTTLSNASWFDAENWVGGELPVAGDDVTVVIDRVESATDRRSIFLDAPTPRFKSVLINGTKSKAEISLFMTNWTTRLEADTVEVGAYGYIKCSGPFSEQQMSNRIWIVCRDLTVQASIQHKVDNAWSWAGAIDANNRGYISANGPGRGYQGGAAHGGCGGRAMQNGFDFASRLPYGNAAYPIEPGSGGSRTDLMGGGVVLIEATGTVTVNGAIRASATERNFTGGQGAGSGGSVCISCKKIVGKGSLLATGADGVSAWDVKEIFGNFSPPGGGGRIAVIYDPAEQKSSDADGLTISVAPGIYRSQWHSGSREPSHFRSPTIADRYFQDADLGTVWFTDDKLLKAANTVAKLKGQVVHPVDLTFDSLDLTTSFLRFSAPGAKVKVLGDLNLTGPTTRLEFGGSTATNFAFGFRLRSFEPWSLEVGGNVTLSDGARLDIRSAATNGTDAAGALVKIDGALTLNGYTNEYATVSDLYRVTNTSVVVWSDPYNGGSAQINVGSLTVHSNAFISAYNRGFAGGGALSDAGIDGYPATGFGPGGGESDTNGSNRGGGGHGGKGGCGIATSRGVAYDDAYRPSLAGSGGGARYCNRLSLSGGGCIRIAAKTDICLDGTISADGGQTVDSNSSMQEWGAGGAGAGGTILLDCKRFFGAVTGRLSAHGGDQIVSSGKNNGGGGGGLIAVWTGEAYEPGQSLRSTRAKPVAFHDESEEAQFLGTVDVHGGVSHIGTDAWKGGDGTAFCFSNHRPGLKVIVR